MAENKVRIEDHNGEIYYPHTTSDVVFMSNGESVEEKFNQHLDETMPHRYVDGGKTYRWGFRTVNGEPEFIYEEVV